MDLRLLLNSDLGYRYVFTKDYRSQVFSLIKIILLSLEISGQHLPKEGNFASSIPLSFRLS